METIDIEAIASKLKKELTSDIIYDENEINAALSEAKLDFEKEYEKPECVISFIEDYHKEREVLTLGNISLTIGAAKSKKTFYSTMLLASMLGSENFAIKGNSFNKKIVFFDTEQSSYHVQRVANRLKRLNLLLNDKTNNIEMYMLRQYMPEMRLAMINQYLTKNKGQYSFIIIDGIVDLLYDFNDIRESKRVITKLMEWSGKLNCHINCILHTNKDKNNARGHLGAELMNKSECVFRIVKEDENISIVECEASRNEAFKSFNFMIEKGLPVRNEMPLGFYDNTPSSEPVINRYTPEPKILLNDEGINPDMLFDD